MEAKIMKLPCFCALTPKAMGGVESTPPYGFSYLQPKRFEIELCNFLTFPNI